MKRFICALLSVLTVMTLCAPCFAHGAFAQEPNVALGKSVMGVGSGLDTVTDGRTTNDAYWDGGNVPASVVIDLDGFFDISSVNVITYYGDGRSYKFSVEGSVDGLSYFALCEKTDGEKATREGTTLSCAGTLRYLRVTVKSNTANSSAHLVEVSAYGHENETFVPPERPTVDENDPDNIAYGKPVRSNSSAGFTAAVNDGNVDTAWEGEDYPRYVDIDLRDNYIIERAVLCFKSRSSQSFTLYGSTNGVSFERLYRSDGFKTAPKAGLEISFGDRTVRILRVMLTGNADGIRQKANLAEVRVYGKKSGEDTAEIREKLHFSSYEEWLNNRYGVDVADLEDANGRYDIAQTYTAADTVEELNGMVSRLLGDRYIPWFEFVPAPSSDPGKDYFCIEDAEGKIRVSGSDGTCIAAGLNWYLKYYCGVHISQQSAQVKMPPAVIPVGGQVYKDTTLKLRYAYNYCTLSYTMAFFGYDEWRRELDWLFLNGVNLILDTTGTEALWVHYLQQLGYNADDAKNYVCGYGYKAWWLMGNLEGYGGSVSDMWIFDTLKLARVNQRSMTVMGARPALQTFVGAMPQSFKSVARQKLKDLGYSDIGPYLAPQGSWAGLLTRPNVLRTDYDGYSYLADLFYKSQEYIYGQVTHYYCGDVCHEGGIIPEGLKKEEMSARILSELMENDPQGVWILQRWWDNPLREVLDGFGAYRTTNILVLDLNTAQTAGNFTNTSKYGKAEFGGTAWIASSLDNYGGNPGMHGALQSACANILRAKKSASYLRGLGITPEGTQNNPVYMDLYWELVWRDEAPDLNEWIADYAARRYGTEDRNVLSAWKKLLLTVYTKGNADDGGPMRLTGGSCPSLKAEGGYYEEKYDRAEFYDAICLLMKSFDLLKDSECYIYDLTDALNTYLGTVEMELIRQMRNIAKKPKEGDAPVFENLANKYLDVLLLVNEISAYNRDELIGRWIGRGKDFMNDERTSVYDDYSADMTAFNAKCLITAWHSGTLIDYASRRYNGLVLDYYYKSWSVHLNYLTRMVRAKTKCETRVYDENSHFKNAWNFILNDKTYRDTAAPAQGDATSRGLSAIFDHVSANYAPDRIGESLTVWSLPDRSAYRVEEGVLYGVTFRTTPKDLAAGMKIPEGCAVAVLDENGNEQSADTALDGCFTLELRRDGVRVDALRFVTEGRERQLYFDRLPFGAAGLIAETLIGNG